MASPIERLSGRVRTAVAAGAMATAPHADPSAVGGDEAKAALAAERARVAALKASSMRTARVGVRPTSATIEAQTRTPLASTPAANLTPAQQGVRLAMIAALLVPLSGAVFLLGDRYLGRGSAPRTIVETPVALDTNTPTASVESPITEGSPADAPAAGSRAGDSAPDATPSRRRVSPETATDDLSHAPSGLPSTAALGAARPTTAGITGIAVDTGGLLPSPTELARRMAPASGQGPRPLDVAAPSPAPTHIAARSNDALGASDGDAVSLSRPGVDLPPPQIGPMSLRLAAQNGDPAAQFEVAVRFAEAKGIRQDFAQALTWYQRAAQKGFVPAQYRLATLYERGLAGPADIARAKLWYKRAADQGNTKAMHNLAVLATTENPKKPDYATAARLFTEAADRGLADSQYNLAVLYDTGMGVSRDPLLAYKWYALAARSGDVEATKRRDQVFAGLTAGQTRDAEKLVEGFQAKFSDPKANDPRAAALAWQSEQAHMRAQAERAIAEGRARADAADAPATSSAAPPPAAQPATVRVAAPARITTKPLPTPKPIP